MKSKIIEIFEKIQKIPYGVCKFDKDKLENIKEGDCRHKSELLYRELTKEGFDVKKVKVIFDWKDTPVPKNLLEILKKSRTVWEHDSVEVKMKDKWIKVDCTWDPELKKLGFPITENWDGQSDTIQITKGKLLFFDIDNYKKNIQIVREEALAFAEALNKWISSVRK